LLEKLDAEVLHSTASMWKYSRTPKVKAVDGLVLRQERAYVGRVELLGQGHFDNNTS
jgi:hypothetical protein